MQRLAYILTQTARNLRQTWETQLMTLLAVTLSVLIFTFFFLLYINLLRAGERLGGDIRLVVFLDEEVAAQARKDVEHHIRSFGEVEKVVFVTRAEAFARLEERLGGDRDILAGLDPEFLPPSIEVYPEKDLRSLAGIDRLSQSLQGLPGVARVQYGREWLSRFASFTGLVRVVVLTSGGLLALGMIFMVSYTIRLTVHSRRRELEILRLLGATAAYIQLPLLLEGMLQGLLGSGLGLGLLYFLYHWGGQHLNGPAGRPLFEFIFFPAATSAAILLSVVGLCSLAGLASIRRFLRI